MRVLVIESEDAIACAIGKALRGEGFNVSAVSFGDDGVDLVKHYEFDIVLLGQKLPDMSGLEVLRAIRTAKIPTPLMIVSRDSAIASRVKALELGADDFVHAPFHDEELVARIRAIVRRSLSHPQSLITTGKITINLDKKSVEAKGVPVTLTLTEYQLLELFSLRKGATLEKETILNHLYGGRDEPMHRVVDVFVCKLRRKLAAATDGDDYIQTVWGRGYAFREPAGGRPANSARRASTASGNENRGAA